MEVCNAKDEEGVFSRVHRLLGGCQTADLRVPGGALGRIRNFGKIFGVIVALIGLGSASGALLGGIVFDVYGSYSPLLIVGLGAYPQLAISPVNDPVVSQLLKPGTGALLGVD